MHEISKNVGAELQQMIVRFMSYASCLLYQVFGVIYKELYDVTKYYATWQLLLDNTSTYEGKAIDDLAVQYQTRIIYPPAYRPNFNPIERTWSLLKSKVRHIITQDE